jgi:hypothetical protein
MRQVMEVIEGWVEAHREFVRVQSQKIITGISAESDIVRAAAISTGGLPVYCDLGGCLVLMPEGTIVGVDHDGSATINVNDTAWIRVARTAAADKYAPLSALRPSGDQRCEACGGTGSLYEGRIRCGVCGGSGRLSSAGTTMPPRKPWSKGGA